MQEYVTSSAESKRAWIDPSGLFHTMQLVKVGEELQLSIPLPEFAEIVQLVRVGEESSYAARVIGHWHDLCPKARPRLALTHESEFRVA